MTTQIIGEIAPEDVPDAWVEVAKRHYSMHGAGLIRNIIVGVAPLIAAAERARLRAEIDPARLELLADWFDDDDEFKASTFPDTWPERSDEVQQDLRRWAALLRQGRP